MVLDGASARQFAERKSHPGLQQQLACQSESDVSVKMIYDVGKQPELVHVSRSFYTMKRITID